MRREYFPGLKTRRRIWSAVKLAAAVLEIFAGTPIPPKGATAQLKVMLPPAVIG